MNMKERLLGTAIIPGLFSSAYANDKEVVGDVVMEVSGGDLCNLTINMEEPSALAVFRLISYLLFCILRAACEAGGLGS